MTYETFSAYADQTIKQMYFYCSIIMVPIGLSIHLFDIILCSGKELEKNNIGFQFRISTFFNAIALAWNIIIYRYLPTSGIDIESYSNVSCALFVYVSRVLQQIPIYIIVLFSYSAYFTLVHPSKTEKLNKKSMFVKHVLIIISFCLILNISSSIRYLKIVNSTNNRSSLKCSQTNAYEVISPITTSILRCFLPFILIVKDGVKIVYILAKPKLASNVSIDEEIKLAISFGVFWIIFLVFNLPLACVQLITVFYVNVYQYSSDSDIMISLRLAHDYSRVLGYSFYFLITLFNIIFNKIKTQIIQEKLNYLISWF